jgi:hypothetical protein
MTHRIGHDKPHTLANSKYTAPPKYVYIYDENGIPRGIKSQQLTKIQMAQLEAYGKQVARQNEVIENYMPHLKRIPTESLEKEIQRRHDINALRVATVRYSLPLNEDIIGRIMGVSGPRGRRWGGFLMGKPKKPTKAGKPKKPTKVGKSKVGKPKKPTKAGKSKVGKPKKQLKKKK